MRGPVLYCVESPDLPAGIRVPDVHLASDATFKPSTGLPGTTLPLGAKIMTLAGPRAPPCRTAMDGPLSALGAEPTAAVRPPADPLLRLVQSRAFRHERLDSRSAHACEPFTQSNKPSPRNANHDSNKSEVAIPTHAFTEIAGKS